MNDYYYLFPDCKRCRELVQACNRAQNPADEDLQESAYARHLIKDHKLSRLEIVDKTGVFIC